MIALIRFIQLWWSACRLRLDDLLPEATPAFVRLLFLPAPLFSRAQRSPGERLKLWFEGHGPIFIKFGQLLSTRPDLLNEDLARQLKLLQDQVAPFPETEFRQVVEAALGQPVAQAFAQFDTQPLASASLAQVHGAQLHNGDQVVIKALRPGLMPGIKRDMRLLAGLAWLVDQLGPDGRRLHAPELIEEYGFALYNELNLKHEAANTQRIRDNFLDNPINYTPKIYWDYVRENVLVSERIFGIPVTDVEAIKARGIDLKTLAEQGVEIFFTQLFEHNFFHADMHPGNIFVNPDATDPPQYMSVDCAIIGSLTDRERYALAAMLLGVFDRDYRRVAEVQIDAGWVAADTPVHRFEADIRTVCEPIFSRPLNEINFGQMLIELFATARKFDMQMMPSLFLLEKTIVNVEGLGRQLYPELELWSTAAPFLRRWSKERYSPKSAMKQLRYHLPDMLEELPHIPALLLAKLQHKSGYINGLAASDHRHRGSGKSLVVGFAGGILLGMVFGTALLAWVQSDIPFSPQDPLVWAALALLALIVLLRK